MSADGERPQCVFVFVFLVQHVFSKVQLVCECCPLLAWEFRPAEMGRVLIVLAKSWKNWDPEILRTYVGTYTRIMKQDKIMKQDQFRKNKNSYICVVLSRCCTPRPGIPPFFCDENSNSNCACHLPPRTQNTATIIQITVVQRTASYLPICAASTATASVRVDGLSDQWSKPPRKVLYKRTFGAPDQGQMLDVWESQTSESALRWQTRHIAPCHILELTLEVILEVILEHVLGIKIMTSLILDHVARAYLYLGISTGEKVMILLLSHSLGVVTGQNKT